MTILSTPAERFTNLPGYEFSANYIEIGYGLKMHYVDEGPKDGEVVLCLHGEPSWSYLYRKMIPVFAKAGYRVIAPDLIGFGKSDKIAEMDAYSYKNHVEWMKSFIEKLDLKGINLFCQDWGGLIGLRCAAEQSNRFARIVAANTGLPNGKGTPPEAFTKWQQFAQTVPEMPIGGVIKNSVVNPLSKEEIAAYDAPYPDESYKACARVFPSLVPTSTDDPAIPDNLKAWEVLSQWKKPFLTLFSDADPITKGGERIFQKYIPGCTGQAHEIMVGGGHFLQEDVGPELAQKMIAFIKGS
jgi:haloalkane dehalogenase